MKLRKITPTALAILGLALLAAPRLQATTNVLVFDPFTAASGTPLNGTTPQSHGGVGTDPWTAPDTGLVMSGTDITATEAPRWAAIPFSPLDGNKYRISVDANPTHAGADWLALGFAETPTPTGNYPAQRLTGWFLIRGTDPGLPLHSFLGYSTDGGAALGWYTGLHTLSVVWIPRWPTGPLNTSLMAFPNGVQWPSAKHRT